MIIASITALVGALSAFGAAYLAFRGQVEKLRMLAQTNSLDGNREDVSALRAENRLLREEVRDIRAEFAEQVEEEQKKRQEAEERIRVLEGRIGHLMFFVGSVYRLILRDCLTPTVCPLLPLFGDLALDKLPLSTAATQGG